MSTYKINDQPANQELVLRHGNSEKSFTMDKVSNSPFTEVRFATALHGYTLITQQKEFTRIVRVYEADKLKLPSKRQVEKKAAHITKLSSQALTEVRAAYLTICVYSGCALRPTSLQCSHGRIK